MTNLSLSHTHTHTRTQMHTHTHCLSLSSEKQKNLFFKQYKLQHMTHDCKDICSLLLKKKKEKKEKDKYKPTKMERKINKIMLSNF